MSPDAAARRESAQKKRRKKVSDNGYNREGEK